MPKQLSTVIPINNIYLIDYQNQISDLLSNNGYNETINNSLSKSEYINYIQNLSSESSVNIINPLSKDLNVMRQSLLFGGLENVCFNQNRKNLNLKTL